jgi:hypothetical protein
MFNPEQCLTELRQELDALKVALLFAPTIDERVRIHARINACLRVYLQLVADQAAGVARCAAIRCQSRVNTSL